jgi:cytochrome d ubiquinol oxidase subunit I
MVVLGVVFILFLLALAFRRRLLWESAAFRTLSLLMIPAGYAAVLAGWVVAEAGRVPWIVYGLMSIRDGVSSVPVASVAFSLFLMTALYALIFAIAAKLLVRAVRKGPEDAPEGTHA